MLSAVVFISLEGLDTWYFILAAFDTLGIMGWIIVLAIEFNTWLVSLLGIEFKYQVGHMLISIGGFDRWYMTW